MHTAIHTVPVAGTAPVEVTAAALLPTNGLHIRPAGNMQVVMNAEEAAEPTAILKPELAIPHHYAFTKGFLGNEDFLTASLHHGSLQVDTSDPNPRPMIAVLDAKPGLADAFRERIVELVRQVRREPGCLILTAYEARDTPGRFYLYEIYSDAAAFDAHLKTDHVHAFISALPALSTGGPGSLVQLNEIPIPDGAPETATGYAGGSVLDRRCG